MNSFQDRNGGATTYAFSFPSIAVTDIKVTIDNIEQTYLTHYQVDSYSTTSGGTVNFSVGGASATYKNTSNNTVTGTPPSGTLNVRVYRQTKLINDSSGLPAPEADYTPGSSIRAADLDDNQTQIIYATQEERDQTIVSSDIKDGIITSAKIADGTIVTADIANNAINADKIAANAVTASELADDAVDRNAIVNDAVNGTKIADDSIDSEHYVDASIDLQHLASNSVNSSKIVDGSIVNGDIANTTITGAKLVNDTVTETQIAANAITASELAGNAVYSNAIQANAVTQAKMAANSVDSDQYVDGSIDSAHIANDQINSQHYVADSIDTEHYAPNSVDTTAIANNAVTNAQIAADAVQENQLADFAVTTDRIANSAVTNAKVATDAIDPGKLQDNCVISQKIAADAVTGAKIHDNAIGSEHIQANAVTTSEIADAELTTLAGMQSGTASILAGSTALTSTLTELNLLDGKSVVTTVSGSSSDVQLPTAKAVNDQILAVTNALGGFVAIADKDDFPTSNPDPSDNAGTVVSIADAVGISVNSSGVGSGATRDLSSDPVIINGFPSALRGGVGGNANPNVLTTGQGLQVQTTSTAHTYDYHKLVYDEGKAATLQAAVDDFDDRYYGGLGSNPSTKPSGGNRTDGDLYFNTSTNKMKVFNGTHGSGTWDDVATPGDFYINTIASLGASGDTVAGGSATFNGTAKKFTLSNPGLTAQQHLVSVNGVIQKPMSGSVTSAPTEGFAIDGSAIVFSSAPAIGADYFIVTVGSSVNIGTPSDNTVSTAKIQNLAVDTAQLAADAVEGSKIADDAVGAEHIEDLDATVKWVDSAKAIFGTGNDLEIYHTGSQANIRAATGQGSLWLTGDQIELINGAVSENMLVATQNAAVKLYYDNSKKFETYASGTITTGHSVIHGNISLADGHIVKLGSSDDIQIWHDAGAGDNIRCSGTKLEIRSPDLKLQNSASETYIRCISDGAVELYHNNVEMFYTSASGCHVGRPSAAAHLHFLDGGTARFGTGNDLEIYHDAGSTESRIWHTNGSGWLNLRGDAIKLGTHTGTETYLTCSHNGQVDLYHNNIKTFNTEALGVSIRGPEGGNCELAMYADEADDNADLWKFIAGAGGGFYLQNKTSGSWETNIYAAGDGDVQLYHNNSLKLTIGGDLTVGTNTHLLPVGNNAQDLGGSSKRWRNIYTNDLNLSNEGSANSVDGTWGNYTIQEGEDDLFLINRRNGKKYKFNLTEVS